MSILQEYAEIRKSIGEQKYKLIEQFLEENPHYYLSDVYYRESVYREFEAWLKSKEMKAYKVTMTCEDTNGIFNISVYATSEQKAAKKAVAQLERSYPIYKGITKIYSVKEV